MKTKTKVFPVEEIKSRLDSFYKRVAAEYREHHATEEVSFHPFQHTKYFGLAKETKGKTAKEIHVLIDNQTGEVFCSHKERGGFGYQSTFYTIFDSDTELKGITQGVPYAY